MIGVHWYGTAYINELPTLTDIAKANINNCITRFQTAGFGKINVSIVLLVTF